MYTIIDKKELPSTDGYSKSGPVLFKVFADSADDVAVFDNNHPDASPGSVITVLSGEGEEKKYKKQNDGDYVELVESGGGGGADWDAAEGEPGYIANKPFYEYEEPEQYSFDFEDPGYWSESAEYSCFDILSLDSEGYQKVISIFRDNSIQEITLSLAGGDFVFTRSEEYPDYRFDSIVEDQICAYIYYDDEYDDICELALVINEDCVTDYIPDYPGTPENPVAFGVVPIGFVKDSVSKLDQKYVPNADWNASEGEDGYVKNRPFYESNGPITPPGGSPLSFTISSDDLEPLPMSRMYLLPSDIWGALSGILIEWDQTQWYDSGHARVSFLDYNYDLEYWSDNFVPVGDASGTFVDDPDTPVIGLGAMAAGADATSFLFGDFGSVPSGTPITIELVATEVHKIDPKYLPDDDGGITVIPLTYTEYGYYACPDQEVMYEAIQSLGAGKVVMFTTVPDAQSISPNLGNAVGAWTAYMCGDSISNRSGDPSAIYLRFNQILYYNSTGGYNFVIKGWQYDRTANRFYKMESNQ